MSADWAKTLSPPRETRTTSAPARELPPLDSGDRLTRAEFERRYDAHPEIKVAELIEGVVYVSSPTRFKQHGRPHALIVGWLYVYGAATPGVELANTATLRLDDANEAQPDALLRLDPALGGRSRITDDDYLEGAPELIVEVAASSAAYDLHDKLGVYQRHGVQEYLVAQMYEQRFTWFALREGAYEPSEPHEEGVLRSEVFPGLWLHPAAFWAGDLPATLATLHAGLASSEHAAFVARLQENAE